jgi:ADP-heptose:LPS heptosyltransferase
LDKMIIISPWSRPLRDGNFNPKNYPFWTPLLKLLKDAGIYTIQIGRGDEKLIGCSEVMFDKPLADLAEMLRKCDTWISVDNFFPHFANIHGKPGIVLWGQSDPEIFGYKQNTNLLKDKSYLRPFQFDMWEACSYREDCFVTPEQVMEYIK